jgi:hypothetical protein
MASLIAWGKNLKLRTAVSRPFSVLLAGLPLSCWMT